jgi:hypothetical protein
VCLVPGTEVRVRAEPLDTKPSWVLDRDEITNYQLACIIAMLLGQRLSEGSVADFDRPHHRAMCARRAGQKAVNALVEPEQGT